MVKTKYQIMVLSVVTEEAKRIRKEHPELSQPEAIRRAWKSPKVKEAQKKYEEWKAKNGTPTKKPTAKKPTIKKPTIKKATTKKATTKKPAAKRATTKR